MTRTAVPGLCLLTWAMDMSSWPYVMCVPIRSMACIAQTFSSSLDRVPQNSMTSRAALT